MYRYFVSKYLSIVYQQTFTDTNGQKTALYLYLCANHKSLNISWNEIANTLEEFLDMRDLAQLIREKIQNRPQGEIVCVHSNLCCW